LVVDCNIVVYFWPAGIQSFGFFILLQLEICNCLQMKTGIQAVADAFKTDACTSGCSRRRKREGSRLGDALQYEGIDMTNVVLKWTFKFGEVVEPFDPNAHQALFEYPPNPEQEPGTTGPAIKPGFVLNNQVIRLAEVGVVKKGHKKRFRVMIAP
jgi:hypothetical protein